MGSSPIGPTKGLLMILLKLPSAFEPRQKCGHVESRWRSICSAHIKYDSNCGRCRVGRCIDCHPKEFIFFDKESGDRTHPFPNLKDEYGNPV